MKFLELPGLRQATNPVVHGKSWALFPKNENTKISTPYLNETGLGSQIAIKVWALTFKMQQPK